MTSTSSRVARAEFVPLADGVRGFYALPAGAGPFPAVLVYQEAFGVNDYVQSETVRLAEHGFAALAPDLFAGETFGYGDMEPVYARLKSLTDEGLLHDVDAAIAYLGTRPEIARGPLKRSAPRSRSTAAASPRASRSSSRRCCSASRNCAANCG